MDDSEYIELALWSEQDSNNVVIALARAGYKVWRRKRQVHYDSPEIPLNVCFDTKRTEQT